jgi:hypothetical protein
VSLPRVPGTTSTIVNRTPGDARLGDDHLLAFAHVLERDGLAVAAIGLDQRRLYPTVVAPRVARFGVAGRDAQGAHQLRRSVMERHALADTRAGNSLAPGAVAGPEQPVGAVGVGGLRRQRRADADALLGELALECMADVFGARRHDGKRDRHGGGGDQRQSHEIRSDLWPTRNRRPPDATIHRRSAGRRTIGRISRAMRQITLGPSFLPELVMLLPRSCRA